MESITRFCGLPSNGTYDVWETKTKTFGQCFIWTALIAVSNSILLVQSAYLYGTTTRLKKQKISWKIFLLCMLLMLISLSSIIELILSYALQQKHPPSYVLSKSIAFSAWLLLFLLHTKCFIITPGKKSVIKCTSISISLVVIANGLQLHKVITNILMKKEKFQFKELSVLSLASMVHCFLLILLLIVSLFIFCSPATLHRQSSSLFKRNVLIQASDSEDYNEYTTDENSSLMSSGQSQCSYYETYQMRKKEKIDIYLGKAENTWNPFSRFLFLWCNKLIRKGYYGQLQHPDDLFILPSSLDTNLIKERFINLLKIQRKQTLIQELKTGSINNFKSNKKRNTKISILKCLFKCYGKFYLSLGILKFIVDCLGFCSPLLLNLLIAFMENKKEPMKNGYYYAGGLVCTNLLMVLINAQYQYLVKKVGLQARASLITTIYEKTLSVSTSSLSQFSTGQVVNFMSTDTGRVQNFFNSFHQFWSLPFQISVSLYLLYRQVGVSALAAIGFALLLVPVNKVLATKIGFYFERMMHEKDNRVKIISEVLAGIRIVKLYAWENHFKLKINEARKQELKSLKGGKYLDAFCVYFWGTTPVLISVITFSVYVSLGHELTAAKVFTSIALFTMLIAPLNSFPWVINGMIEAWISLNRIQKYISLPEIDLDNYYIKISPEDSDGMVLEMENASFQWQDKDYLDIEPVENSNNDQQTSPEYAIATPFTLKNISLFVEKGQFIGVFGKVGSGKSTLFSSIAAETENIGGHIYIDEDFVGFAYVTQEPWIQHLTIRDNILFGKPFDEAKYNKVIHACAMMEDLSLLPAGDMTEVGENGVTLSGGQKARLSLARAIYQDKELYILDDPLAAVDSHVASHIFQHCIMGLLQNKTRILGTHHHKYLRKSDVVIQLEEGRIVSYGPPEEVLTQEIDTAATSETDMDIEKVAEERGAKNQANGFNSSTENKTNGKFIEEEKKEKGVVSAAVYKSYWKAVGSLLALNILLFLLLMQASRNVSDWFLSYWISHSQSYHNNTVYYDATLVKYTSHVTSLHSSILHLSTVKDYLMIYIILGIVNSVFTLFRAFLFAYGGIQAAKVLHDKLLIAILGAPIAFFDTTPLGRIVNRFSSDVNSIDDELPFQLNIFCARVFTLLGTVVITCYGIPWFTAVLVPIGAFYYHTQRYYRFTSRELKRLSSVTLSPIYEHFLETLSGLITIRAFKETHRFVSENERKLDFSQRANFSTLAAAQWLMIRLNMIAVVVIGAVSFIAVFEHHFNSINPGLVGLAISYALSITFVLSNLITSFTETEKEMICVERVMEYIKTTPKEEGAIGESLTSVPIYKGELEFKKVYLKYREELPYALIDVSFKIRSGEKIGICGRTGSGKSSILRLLFKIVNVAIGDILIDGINLKSANIKDLRSEMSIIPQDLFLFDDTVAKNLDPQEKYSNIELMNVLQKCHLSSAVRELGGLDANVGEKGAKLSVGQKQLLCLARALLKKSKIICIDEATASVDMQTDRLVQQTIRTEFKASTVLTIAHRIETIIDSDRVLVMDFGRVEEFDTPKKLLSNENSLFYMLVKESKTSRITGQ